MTQSLVQIAGGNLLFVLAMAAIVSIILGMGMPTLGVYLLVATLVAPAMVEVGITAKAAHLFALYFGMLSMITPPVAIAAFAAATVARAEPMKTATAAVQFGWSAYVVPFMFVVAPELMMDGPTPVVLQTAITAVIGVWMVSAGFVGYFRSPLNPVLRILYIVAGVSMMIPAGAVTAGIWTDIGGLALAVLLIAADIVFRRKDVAD